MDWAVGQEFWAIAIPVNGGWALSGFVKELILFLIDELLYNLVSNHQICRCFKCIITFF